jgi:hypothetical protein
MQGHEAGLTSSPVRAWDPIFMSNHAAQFVHAVELSCLVHRKFVWTLLQTCC